jgi:Sodium:alanine symporter family
MQEFEKFVGKLSDFVWGPPLLILLLGTHIFLTFRLRFIQRYLGKAIKLSVQRSHEGQGDVSQFGALTTALAATIGTGNIVGVATAIAAGGPGAVFWMWLTGVFGIATKYSEAVLSVKYRVVDHRRCNGGAHRVRDPRWNQIDSEGMRNAGAVYGYLLRRRLHHPSLNEHIGNSSDGAAYLAGRIYGSGNGRRLCRRNYERSYSLRRGAGLVLK